MSVSLVSLSTKKSKRSRLPLAATDSNVARRPANTRGTSSLQIGITSAVRASGAIGSLPALLPEILYLSRPVSSSRKPISAVQKPADTQQNRMPKRTRMDVCKAYGQTCTTVSHSGWLTTSSKSTNDQPWYGRMPFMYQPATMVWPIISASRM
ncbi:hypothetical protein D3C76_804540 [compost metagenome]